MVRRAFDWMFRNRRTGDYTVAQWPNIALGTWLVATLIRVVFSPGGAFGTALMWIGGLALAVWAVDEIARGVNPFRRILGGLVVLGLVVSRL